MESVGFATQPCGYALKSYLKKVMITRAHCFHQTFRLTLAGQWEDIIF